MRDNVEIVLHLLGSGVPDAHIAHGYGVVHAPVSAHAQMIELLPDLDSLVGRCSVVLGRSR